jgi:hypothetical protein
MERTLLERGRFHGAKDAKQEAEFIIAALKRIAAFKDRMKKRGIPTPTLDAAILEFKQEYEESNRLDHN